MESKEAQKGFRKLIFGIVGYLFIVFLTNLFPYNPDNGLLSVGLTLIIMAIFVNNILGVKNGVKSIRLKEKSRWMKYIGLFGNIISGLSIGILLFFNTLEVIGYLERVLKG